MYFNDVHILYYVLFGIIGLIVGKFIGWCNQQLPENKKIFTRQMLKDKNTHYILMVINSVLYIILLYNFGLNNLNLYKFMCLTPMLLSALVIDYKLQIIPNRLNLTMFEIGLVFLFICGLTNINLAINMLLGMFVGGGIFLIITLIGGLIAGKEAMGLGDVKLMGALGLYFGVSNIIVIAVVSFLLGAIVSVALLLKKSKKTDEYIPFGPFIVIASFISIFVPFTILLTILLKIFTLGMFKVAI